MNIAIDIRSLQSGQISGVENYCSHVVENILRADRENHYTLFYNSLNDINFEQLHFINSRIINFKIPNKILNASIKFFGYPPFEKFIGKQDIVFFPNSNFYRFSGNTKKIITLHDLSPFIRPEFFDLRRQVWHKMISLKKKVLEANRIIAVSEFTKQDCVRVFGVEPEKIEVIYPGVTSTENYDEQRLREIRNKYELPGDYICFISTLEPRKNLVGLIEAFERLEVETHLVIAGKPGWKYGEIFKKISKSPKRNNIHYLGYVDEVDKLGIIKLSRLLAYPSFYEGFGFVPLEAFSLGVPVLSANLTSLPEITNGAALLVDPYDTSEIAYGLNQLLLDNNLRDKLTKAGLLESRRFSWRQAGLAHVNLFKQI